MKDQNKEIFIKNSEMEFKLAEQIKNWKYQ